MSRITIPARGGSFGAYLASPEKTPAPAIVLLQEVYGVNRFMRRIADFWAVEGFIAVCPELYWRIGPGIELDPETPGHRERALETRQGMDIDAAVEDVIATVAQIRRMPESNGRVGTSGYCLGGLLAYLTATRGDADCNVSYYGVGIENYLGEAGQLRNPLMLHIGGADPWTPPEVQQKLADTLGRNPHVTIHTYPGVGHAFAREGAATDVPEARARANARTRSFFGEILLAHEPTPAAAFQSDANRPPER